LGGGIPSLGTGLLGLLLPQQYQGFASVASPLTTSFLQLGGNAIGNALGLGTNIAGNANAGWGGVGLGSYGSVIGMVAAAVYNVIKDVMNTNNLKRAERKLEGGVLNAYSQNAPYVDNLYQQLSQYLPNQGVGQTYQQNMMDLPEWAQPLFSGGTGLQNELYGYHNPLMLFTSPLLQMFNDPSLRQQLISSTMGGLANPENVDFSQWENLTPYQKKQMYDQMIWSRGSIPGGAGEPAQPMTAKEWQAISEWMGSEDSLDPFQMLGGMYQHLYDLSQTNPNYAAESEDPKTSKPLAPLYYAQPKSHDMTAAGWEELLNAYGFNNPEGPSGFETFSSSTNRNSGTDRTPGELSTLLSTNWNSNMNRTGLPNLPLGTSNQSAFTPGALRAVSNAAYGLPDPEEYSHANEALDQMMQAMGHQMPAFVH
jgi:hypothetical protein